MQDQQRGLTRQNLDGVRAELRWQGRCLSILATATIGMMLYVLRPVLVPFVVAVFLTVGLKPLLDLLQHRLKLGRLAAVAVVFLLAVGLLFALGVAIGSSIDEMVHDNAYMNRAEEVVERVASTAESTGLLRFAEKSEADAEQPSVVRLKHVLDAGFVWVQQWLLNGMAALTASLGIVLIYMLFLLLGASHDYDEQGELWHMIESKLREYIVLKTLISIGTGIAVWLVLAIFGVPLALLIGLLTFLLNYIPNFGPLVTCLLPLPLIWLNPDMDLGSMVAASVLSCGVQLVGGNIIEPRLMGASFQLHPIVVLFALMLWFAIWGFVGMLLAVPITAALKVVLERMERTAPIARLLAGDLGALTLGKTTEGA